MKGEHIYPICKDTRPCFAKIREGKVIKCKALSSTYPGNKCPFCKLKRNETKGKIYGYNEYYGRSDYENPY